MKSALTWQQKKIFFMKIQEYYNSTMLALHPRQVPTIMFLFTKNSFIIVTYASKLIC